MSKYIYTFYFFISVHFLVQAQVGIFTNTPAVTLDVSNREFSASENGNLIAEGIGIPTISKQNLALKNYEVNGYSSNQDGTIVFVDDLSGDFTEDTAGNNAVKNITDVNQYYMFNGTIWLPTSGEPPSPFLFASTTPSKELNPFIYSPNSGAFDDQLIPFSTIGLGDDSSYIESIHTTIDNNRIKIKTDGFYDIKAYFGWNSGNSSVINGDAVVVILKLQKSTDNGTTWTDISSAPYSMLNLGANIGTTLRIPNVITSLIEDDLLRFVFQSPQTIPTTSDVSIPVYTPSLLKEHNNGTINKATGLTYTQMIIINKI